MDREELLQLLPHRSPMLLLDRMDIDADGTGHGLYRIPDDAFFCQGHFPGNPIVPGVILCEIMAQACLCLDPAALQGRLGVYRGINDVKFRQIVRPGDLCEITGRIEEKKAGVHTCSARIDVAGRLACRGSLTIALIPSE